MRRGSLSLSDADGNYTRESRHFGKKMPTMLSRAQKKRKRVRGNPLAAIYIVSRDASAVNEEAGNQYPWAPFNARAATHRQRKRIRVYIDEGELCTSHCPLRHAANYKARSACARAHNRHVSLQFARRDPPQECQIKESLDAVH